MTDNDRIVCLYRGDFSNFHPVLVLSDFCLKPNWQLCQCFEACQIFPCAWPWPLGSMKLDNLEFSETIFRNIQPFGFLITTKIRCRNEICKEEGADAVWRTSWEDPLKGKRRVHGAPLFLVFVCESSCFSMCGQVSVNFDSSVRQKPRSNPIMRYQCRLR